MISLFDGIYRNRRTASSSQLQLMLKLSQQDLMNGVVEISYSPEEKILFLLNAGKITCAYECKGDLISRASLPNVSALLNGRPEGAIRVCPLAPSFLRAVKTIVEQPHSSKTFPTLTAAIPNLIQECQKLPDASLLHVRWPTAEGFVFVPGNNFPARQYAFLTEGQTSDSAGAVSMFSRWSETNCSAAQYIGDPAVAIWKENNLQLGFALLIEQIMRRYEELVGHLLSRKLEDSINRFSRTQSWNILVANTAVDDVQLFDTFSDGAVAYRSIFDLASRQIAGVIGPRLFGEAMESGLDGLGAPLHQAVQDADLITAVPAN